MTVVPKQTSKRKGICTSEQKTLLSPAPALSVSPEKPVKARQCVYSTVGPRMPVCECVCVGGVHFLFLPRHHQALQTP